MSRARRIQLLGGVIVVAVVVAVAAALLGHSSGKSPVKASTTPVTTTAGSTTTGSTTTGSTTTTTGSTTTGSTTTSSTAIDSPAAITALFAGIPQHGDTLGSPSAPVTMVVFEDPQCPYCDEWNLATLPSVVSQFVRTGKLKLVYRGLLIIGPNSAIGLRAIVGAGLQNKLWNMSEALYANQGKENSGWITSQLVVSLAADIGIDGKKLITDANSKAVTATLVAAAKQAKADKVGGTPTFEIINPPAVPKQLNESSLEPAGFIESLTAAIG
jgi:protein-disulfide isomerase